MTRNPRWRTLLAAASLVVLGAAAGITADRLHHRRPATVVVRPMDMRDDPLGTMDRALDLRPDQRARVAAILSTRQAQIDDAWGDAHHRLLAIIDSVVFEITAELDPDQAKRFRELVNEIHATPGGLHSPR